MFKVTTVRVSQMWSQIDNRYTPGQDIHAKWDRLCTSIKELLTCEAETDNSQPKIIKMKVSDKHCFFLAMFGSILDSHA